jgi:hypothetical protein
LFILLQFCDRWLKQQLRGRDRQLAVESTQRNQIRLAKVFALRITNSLPQRDIMPATTRSENIEILTQGLQDAVGSSLAFDRDLAAKIGKCIAVRRSLCGLSKQQLGARLGIDSAEVEAYEQGEKRMGCKFLLETAKQLKATPRFFFQ